MKKHARKHKMANKIENERWNLLRKAAAALLLVKLCEKENESWRKRGKTRSWIKRRDQLGYFCNHSSGTAH